MLSPTVLTQPHSQCCAFACCVFRNILINRFFFLIKTFFHFSLSQMLKETFLWRIPVMFPDRLRKAVRLSLPEGNYQLLGWQAPHLNGIACEQLLSCWLFCVGWKLGVFCVWQLCTFLLFLKKIFTFRTMENHKTKTGLLGRIFLYFRIYILKFIFIYSISTYIHICINIYTNMYTYIHITTLILTN